MFKEQSSPQFKTQTYDWQENNWGHPNRTKPTWRGRSLNTLNESNNTQINTNSVHKRGLSAQIWKSLSSKQLPQTGNVYEYMNVLDHYIGSWWFPFCITQGAAWEDLHRNGLLVVKLKPKKTEPAEKSGNKNFGSVWILYWTGSVRFGFAKKKSVSI